MGLCPVCVCHAKSHARQSVTELDWNGQKNKNVTSLYLKFGRRGGLPNLYVYASLAYLKLGLIDQLILRSSSSCRPPPQPQWQQPFVYLLLPASIYACTAPARTSSFSIR